MSNQPAFTTWTKSSESGGGDDCVEVAFAPDGRVGVRHSKDPDGTWLVYSQSEWAAFISGVIKGEMHGPGTSVVAR